MMSDANKILSSKHFSVKIKGTVFDLSNLYYDNDCDDIDMKKPTNMLNFSTQKQQQFHKKKQQEMDEKLLYSRLYPEEIPEVLVSPPLPIFVQERTPTKTNKKEDDNEIKQKEQQSNSQQNHEQQQQQQEQQNEQQQHNSSSTTENSNNPVEHHHHHQQQQQQQLYDEEHDDMLLTEEEQIARLMDSDCCCNVVPQQEEEEERPFMEVEEGRFVPLRGSAETWQGIIEGKIQQADCWVCSTKLECLKDADFVLCPECRSITPLPEDPNRHVGGVGLGIKRNKSSSSSVEFAAADVGVSSVRQTPRAA